MLQVINVSRSIGDRYAARSLMLRRVLSIGDRYAARSLMLRRVLSIGDRYAARSLMLHLPALEAVLSRRHIGRRAAISALALRHSVGTYLADPPLIVQTLCYE